jgi:membrane protein implicated in regulation of membrane protease activity
MNEEGMYRWLMISTAVLAALCGLGAVAFMVLCAIGFSWGLVLCSLLMTGGAIGSGYATVYFSQKTTVPKVFNNQDEREVLTNKQRKVLKRARGEVVMEKAMIEVEHERENIVHNQMQAIEDPNRPPHVTRWSSADGLRALGGKVVRIKDNDETGRPK